MATEKTQPVYDNSILRFMAKAGVRFEDARWFHLKMVGDGFKNAADRLRAKSILNQTYNVAQRVVCA